MDLKKAKKIVEANLTKTMGCTDIGVVGYIASIGSYVLRDKKIESVTLNMSEELYKNAVNVGVPGLKKSGLDKALALGILLKNPKKQLSVFESVTNDDIAKIEGILNQIEVKINYKRYEDTVLYEELTITSTEGDIVTIIIKDSYDNVTSVEFNGDRLKDFEKDKLIRKATNTNIKSYDEILEFVHRGEFKGLENLFDIAQIQYENARREIRIQGGKYLVEDLRQEQKECMYDLSNFLRKHISVPSRKRMEGDIYTVYGVAGSGNLGIGTLISPKFLAHSLNISNEEEQKLIVLSFFTSVYVKQKMSIVTVLCGTGHATGCSTAAVTTFIRKGTNEQIKQAVNLYLSTSMGYVCDGAKLSCTNKVAFAAMNGMIAGKMVIDNDDACDGTGLNKIDIEISLDNLGKLNNEILSNVNKGIIELI
ncbi:MAG: L-serine ammonia-lyase, iron-sulfur-dependent, subunit alpha [Candidatus Izemoplasma sp.]